MTGRKEGRSSLCRGIATLRRTRRLEDARFLDDREQPRVWEGSYSLGPRSRKELVGLREVEVGDGEERSEATRRELVRTLQLSFDLNSEEDERMGL